MWRRQVRSVRTLGPLKRKTPNSAQAARALERARPEVVQTAAHNPEHSEAGRSIAREAVACAGSPFGVRVPGFVPGEKLSQRGEALFFGWGRTLRLWSGWLLLPLAIGMFVAVGMGSEAERALFARAVADGVVSQEAIDALDASFEWSEEVPAIVAGVYPDDPNFAEAKAWRIAGYTFIGAFLLVALVWIGASALRRRPARLLLLRKFNRKALSKGAERLISAELKPFGHVLTLSDKHLRPSRFSWVGQAIMVPGNPAAAAALILSIPFRLIWRTFDRSRMGPVLVANARDWRLLAWRLRDRVGLNWQASLAGKEAILIRTSDAWWQAGIELLMASSDAIVADLSHVTEGTAWELDQIRAKGAVARCVFVAIQANAEHAREAMAAWGFADRPLFLYDKLGVARDKRALRAAIVAAIAQTACEAAPQAPSAASHSI